MPEMDARKTGFIMIEGEEKIILSNTGIHSTAGNECSRSRKWKIMV